MKAFLIAVGTVSALIVIAHFARMIAEPRMATDPWYWLMTLIAAGLSAWAWRLLRSDRQP